MNIIRYYGRKVKAWYYRHKYHLKHIDKTVYFGGKSSISRDLRADRYAYIGPNCVINKNVTIGAYTMLANNVYIIGGDHLYNKVGTPIIFSGRDVVRQTTIGRDCWIGAHTIIMCGVKIGEGSIVAAGSVITKDIDPFTIYGGVPAKKIKDRFESKDDVIRHSASLDGFPKKVDPDMFCS